MAGHGLIGAQSGGLSGALFSLLTKAHHPRNSTGGMSRKKTMPRIHDSATEGLRKREVVRAGADGTGACDVGEVIGVRWDSSGMERV